MENVDEDLQRENDAAKIMKMLQGIREFADLIISEYPDDQGLVTCAKNILNQADRIEESAKYMARQ